ncbi:MAG: hypothetical protein K8J31_26540, partial [Anaerolineae bacterium]|nr:hypothetical protein [Anaerolineae bacterium]
GSTYLLPLGIIILFSYGGTAILRAGMKRSMRFWPLTQALVLVGLLVCVLIRLPRDGSGEIVAEPSTETVITDLLNNTVVAEPDEVFLVPLNWNWFRLNTQHPIYVDLKNHPYLPSEVIEWWRRVNLAEAFYAQPTISDEQFSQACQQFNVAYVMIADSQARLSAVPIATAKGFQLFRCPASST